MRAHPLLIALLLASTFLALAAGNITSNSATADELVHLSSGWTALHWRDFRLNPEHPPLAKIIGANAIDSWLPEDPRDVGDIPDASLSSAHFTNAWNSSIDNPELQWLTSHHFSYPVRDSYLRLHDLGDPTALSTLTEIPEAAWLWNASAQLVRARTAMLVFPLLLAAGLYAIATRTVNHFAALLALGFLSLDPNFIAHGALVTTDVAAATMIFLAVAGLRRWLDAPSAASAMLLALATGVALTVKFSTVILAPLLLLLAAGRVLRVRNRTVLLRAITGISLAAAGVFTIIWGSYGFRWSATADGTSLPTEALVNRRAAVSALMARGEEVSPESISAEGRSARAFFADEVLYQLHRSRILPEAWTHGLIHVRAHALPRNAFLNGRISATGFPDYFIWTFLLKSPLGLLVALAVTVVMAAKRRVAMSSLWWWGVPLLTLFVLASTSRFNIGHRHLLAIYPFLWLLAAEAIAALNLRARAVRPLVALIAFFSLAAPLAVLSPTYGVQMMPGQHLAYFNELAGGPLGGRRFLVDSNLDWGQDTARFAEWWREEPSGPLVAWAVTSPADLRRMGAPHLNTRFGYPFAPLIELHDIPAGALLAVSATSASGVLDDPRTRDYFRRSLAQWERVARVGYTIDVYARRQDLRTSPPPLPR